MPRGDQTGPEGYGSMTGRAAGFCAGYSRPGCASPGRAGMGLGRGGGGGGRGRRNQYYATGLTGWQRTGFGGPSAPAAPYPVDPYYSVPPTQPTAAQEANALKNQVKFLEESIKSAQERIEELEATEK